MPTDRFARVSRILGATVVVGLLVVAFTPVINLVAGAMRPPLGAARSDAIVVLGAGVNPNGSLRPASLVRLVHGVVLYREGWAPTLVLTGKAPELTERARLATALGVPPAAIVANTVAQTTQEEAAGIAADLKARGLRRILLVTNTRHLVRAGRLFAKHGLVVNSVAADLASDSATDPEVRLDLLRSIAQELFARAYYRLTGRL